LTLVELKGFINLIEVIVDNYVPQIHLIQPWSKIVDCKTLCDFFSDNNTGKPTHVNNDMTLNVYKALKEKYVDSILAETNFTKNEYIIEAYLDTFNSMISSDYQGLNTNNLSITLQD